MMKLDTASCLIPTPKYNIQMSDAQMVAMETYTNTLDNTDPSILNS